jgi:hypothetical protein
MIRENLTPQSLIDLVNLATPLTPEHYPALAQLSGNPRENFIVGHSIRHLSKSVGKMQAVIESAEHGDQLDKKQIEEKLAAATFSICKLCSVLGITADKLADGVYEMVKAEQSRLAEAQT